MLLRLTGPALGLAMATSVLATPAWAQDNAEDLMALDTGALRSAVRQRYDEALALTTDANIVAGDAPRFTWASQAKAQCGIALGFLRGGRKDPVSIGKCVDASRRMRIAAPAPAPIVAETPQTRPEACGQQIAGIVFFDFDSAALPASAAQTLDAVVNYTKVCAWQKLVVTGHTDRSGSDAYNQRLSVQRAEAVGAQLAAMGMPAGVVEVSGKGETEPKVPTIDGERNPTNRRVEITVQ